MSIQDFLEFRWWYLLVVPITIVLTPLFRALAAVIVGRSLRPDLAKLAIPHVLRPSQLLRGLRRPKTPPQ